MRERSPNPLRAPRSPSVARPAWASVPVLGNSFASAFLAGVLSDACAELSATVTLTGTSSLEPSGYVTTTVASLSPGVLVSTGVLYSNLVPSGRSPTFPIDFLGSGVSPTLTVCSLGVGVFLSASVRGSVTVTLTGTSSLEPSG